MSGLRGLLSWLQCGNGVHTQHMSQQRRVLSQNNHPMPDSSGTASARSAVLQLTARVAALEKEIAALRRKVNALGPKVRSCQLTLGEGKCRLFVNMTLLHVTLRTGKPSMTTAVAKLIAYAGNHRDAGFGLSAGTVVASSLIVIVQAYMHLFWAGVAPGAEQTVHRHVQGSAVRKRTTRKPKAVAEPRSRAKQQAAAKADAVCRPGHTRHPHKAEDAASPGNEEQDGDDDDLMDEPPAAKRQRTTHAAGLSKAPSDDRAPILCRLQRHGNVA